MNKTPVIIVIVAILVLCCCSICALSCTLYFLTRSDDLSQRGQWASNIEPETYAYAFSDAPSDAAPDAPSDVRYK